MSDIDEISEDEVIERNVQLVIALNNELQNVIKNLEKVNNELCKMVSNINNIKYVIDLKQKEIIERL